MQNEVIFAIASEIQVYAALLLKFFNQSVEERLREQGESISSLQHGILRMLEFETLTISILSQRLGLDPSGLVRSIDSLERKGLVQRGIDPYDRRRTPIRLTEKGESLVKGIPIIARQDPTYKALEALGEESTIQLRDLLVRVIQQFPEGKFVSGLMSGSPNALPPSLQSKNFIPED